MPDLKCLDLDIYDVARPAVCRLGRAPARAEWEDRPAAAPRIPWKCVRLCPLQGIPARRTGVALFAPRSIAPLFAFCGALHGLLPLLHASLQGIGRRRRVGVFVVFQHAVKRLVDPLEHVDVLLHGTYCVLLACDNVSGRTQRILQLSVGWSATFHVDTYGTGVYRSVKNSLLTRSLGDVTSYPKCVFFLKYACEINMDDRLLLTISRLFRLFIDR